MRRRGTLLVCGCMVIYYRHAGPLKNSSLRGQKNCGCERPATMPKAGMLRAGTDADLPFPPWPTIIMC
jgi:hypothetical protein